MRLDETESIECFLKQAVIRGYFKLQLRNFYTLMCRLPCSKTPKLQGTEAGFTTHHPAHPLISWFEGGFTDIMSM